MSTTPKKNTPQRVRYTDAQKKEIVDFVASYNATNGRGGQSEAAKKFKVSPISIGAWLKGSGAAAPKKAVKAAKVAKASKAPKAAKKVKAPKAPKAPKAAKARQGKGNTRIRYTDEQKKEVLDFVASYNAQNGRGGQSKAASKFKISPITVMAWLKAAGVKASPKKGKKAAKAVKAPKAVKAAQASSSGSLDAKLGSILALIKEIAEAEAALAQLKGRFSSLKASL